MKNISQKTAFSSINQTVLALIQTRTIVIVGVLCKIVNVKLDGNIDS